MFSTIRVLANLAALRAYPRPTTNDFYQLKDTKAIYRYDGTSSATDDADEVVKPNNRTTGRYLRQLGSGGTEGGQRAINVLRMASNGADTETITIGADVYELDRAANGVTAGRIAVTGQADDTPTNVLTALETRINAKVGVEKVTAKKISANELIIIADEPGAVVLACAETLGGANNAWAAAAMYGGRATGERKQTFQMRVPTAVEVALGNMHFVFDFVPALVLVFIAPTATPNAAKAHDGGITIDATTKRVVVDNAGSTDWAATDNVSVLAFA